MDTLGSLPFPLSASPFHAPPDERLTACLHPTGWYSLNAPHVCKLSGCWKKKKKSVGGGVGGGTHGIQEQRVMSELPGLVSAGPSVWIFSRAALKNWIPVPPPFFFFFFFPSGPFYFFKFSRVFLRMQAAIALHLCWKMRPEWGNCVLKIWSNPLHPLSPSN